jgi:hypothetical protein
MIYGPGAGSSVAHGVSGAGACASGSAVHSMLHVLNKLFWLGLSSVGRSCLRPESSACAPLYMTSGDTDPFCDAANQAKCGCHRGLMKLQSRAILCNENEDGIRRRNRTAVSNEVDV